jgi:hypothetical protein
MIDGKTINPTNKVSKYNPTHNATLVDHSAKSNQFNQYPHHHNNNSKRQPVRLQPKKRGYGVTAS